MTDDEKQIADWETDGGAAAAAPRETDAGVLVIDPGTDVDAAVERTLGQMNAGVRGDQLRGPGATWHGTGRT